MKRRSVTDPELAQLGEFEGRIERNQGFVQAAHNHNLGRNVRVAKVLAYLGLMRSAGITLSGPVGCRAAVWQSSSASSAPVTLGLRRGAMQAAHFLPGEIKISGRSIWEYVRSSRTRGEIQKLFADVDHLERSFNQADTEAEAKQRAAHFVRADQDAAEEDKGLCWAFARACGALIVDPALGRSGDGPVLQEGPLARAFDLWNREARLALQNAIHRASSRPSLPPLVPIGLDVYTAESIMARSTAPAMLWNRDGVLRVLRRYLESQMSMGADRIATTRRPEIKDLERRFQP